MWRVLCGESSVELKEASMSPLPQLWINHPQSVKDHLCFIPVRMMGTWTLDEIRGARTWMRYSEGISYGQPSNAIVERQSQRTSLAEQSAPKNWAKTQILAIHLIYSCTDENKLFSQTLKKRQCPRFCPKSLKMDGFRWFGLHSDLLPCIMSSRKAQHLICAFISTLVHYGLVHSILSTNPSVCSVISVLSKQHGTGACGTEPSVSHWGGAARHAKTIKAMDFHCSPSLD